MKQAKKYKIEIKAVTKEKETGDGDIETSIIVKTIDKPVNEYGKPFPLNDVVLEKEAIKKENFKSRATSDVRNAANKGISLSKSLTYWKEAGSKKASKKEDETINIGEQSFTIDQVKQAFKSSEDLKSLTGKVTKTRIIAEVEKLDNDALDALLFELDN